LQSYIERFRAKATKARQAQSRIKALQRMEMISAAHIDTPFDFSFREMQNVPDPLLVLDDVSVGYGDTTILSNIELALRPGERLGLLGRNGAGKSTLIKLLASELAMKSGKRVEGKDLKIGYFAQHQLEQLRLDESPLEHMQKLDPETREQEHRNYLGGFDFKGDMASSPCGPFSGGEKSRLALALLIWTRPNLLLLDEPTNHLDLEMRHALTVALQEYQGGVVIVSHDRAMLRATCDKFMLVAHGKAEVFDGDLDDYKDWLNAQKLADKQGLESSKEVPVSANKVDRAQSKADRQARIAERRPLLKESEQIETNMARWEQDKSAIDHKLADPDLYAQSDKSLLQDLLKRQAELMQQLETAEMRWLELQEMLEALPAIQ
jgi:ATP-binding cassette subfamily F protein 3